MSSVGIVIGTYGNRVQWTQHAQKAIASIHRQTRQPDDWIHVHGATLADARNRGAEILGTDRLIFLDADDELDAGYVEAMMFNAELSSNPWTIWRPSTIGVYPDGTTDPEAVMIPVTDLRTRNCIVIGAMCPSDLFYEVGGFQEYPILEDWALWRSMVAEGCAVDACEAAVYRVHVRDQSRNSDHVTHHNVYRQIMKDVPL